ncbi:hypothetical protein [Ureaplasma zalophigenitalium]|uniref:methenyltetrahydrofolate cyclohydrolase n=1 Tax=Ureaplasma zalophigenitalium TaxID=907723 RepID=A0ABT3BNX8_9BACT|nr:hypothetical protein [Ureaplasma zalophigenitalium]MCV3753944.1 hypothetical protein [Ureaplasma zalophigenitalium]
MKQIINDLFIKLNNELDSQRKDHQKIIHIFYDSFFVSRNSLYLRVKEKYANQLGIPLRFYDLALFRQKNDLYVLMEKIHKENGFIFYELPIRQEIKTNLALWSYLTLSNDIDGLHTYQYLNNNRDAIIYYPATVLAVCALFNKIEPKLKKRPILCVLGRGEHLGRYLHTLLKDDFAETYLIGRDNLETKTILKKADCVIACINQAHAYDITDLKDHSFLIDVTLEENEHQIQGAFKYNLDYQQKHAIKVSPSPGGVGKLTTLCLFLNYYKK